MATQRKIVFENGYIYHIFNRGIERRSVFTNKRDFDRATNLIKFYKHKDIPIRFSQLLLQPQELRNEILKNLYASEKIVEILCYCLMPNHFHFMLKQITRGGIARFISNITNAYTKYFNTKYQRVGPLFQGTFKAVLVESDEQLIHLSRYIHLNPVSSSLIESEKLKDYTYSSYFDYISSSGDIVNREPVLSMFKNVKEYEQFVLNQADYARKLEKIKHLAFDER